MSCSPLIWVGDDAQLLPTGTILDSDGNPLFAANSFSTMQTDLGTFPVADSTTDVLTWTSTSLDITGNATADTITIEIDTTNANTWTGQQTFNTVSPIIGPLTAGSVIFVGASKELAEANANFSYDSSTGYLTVKSPTTNAVAVGHTNTAGGTSSLVFGLSNTVSALSAMALGGSNTASGSSSQAQGFTNTAQGISSQAFGTNNIALTTGSQAWGRNIFCYRTNTLMAGISDTVKYTLDATGMGIFTESPQMAHHVNGNALISNGATLGSELVTNGTFTGNANGWTLGSFVYNVNNVIKNADGTSPLTPSTPLTITAGKVYRVTFNINTWTAGTLTVTLGGTTGPSALLLNTTNNRNFSFDILAVSTGNLSLTPSNTARFIVDTVSVMEVLGGNLNVVNAINIGSGNMGTPQARLYLPAGTTTALSAPLKFTSGTSMTAAEAGAVEFTTDDLFFTITTGTARKRFLFADDTAGLTSTRVPFATTNGRLTDSANMTYATNRLSPTYITLAAGTTSAGTSPMKLTSGISMSSAEAGAVEFTTDDLFFTITTGTARKRFLFADPSGGLTSARMPFATTNGRLTDDSSLTYSTSTGLSTSKDVTLNTAGAGLKIKEGTNATMGTATLSGGFATVSTTKVQNDSRIFLTCLNPVDPGTLCVDTIGAGTSFDVVSTNGADASTFSWLIINPAS